MMVNNDNDNINESIYNNIDDNNNDNINRTAFCIVVRVWKKYAN